MYLDWDNTLLEVVLGVVYMERISVEPCVQFDYPYNSNVTEPSPWMLCLIGFIQHN